MTFTVQEYNPKIREAFYELFGIVMLEKAFLVTEFIRAISENIKRYPEDSMMIYQCGAKLGRMYSTFVRLNAVALLQHNPNYLIQEKDIDDPIHILNVIIVANSLNSSSLNNLELPFYFSK